MRTQSDAKRAKKRAIATGNAAHIWEDLIVEVQEKKRKREQYSISEIDLHFLFDFVFVVHFKI